MRIGVLAGVSTLALATTGCWLQPRLEPGRSNHLPSEGTLTADTVAGLTEVWSMTLGDDLDTGAVNAPVALNGRIYAVADGDRDAGDVSFVLAAAADASTGAPLWNRKYELLTLSLPDWLDDPVIDGGAVMAPYTLLLRPNPSDPTIGFDMVVDLATGGWHGDWSDAPSSQDLAVVDGQIVRKTVEVAELFNPPYTATVTAPGFTPTVAGAAEMPGDYAFVGDSVAWSDGATAATGYSPLCPETGGVPRSTACSPDWTTDLGAAPGNPTAVGADQVAYADASGTVSVLDMATGAVAWQAELGAPALSQPTVTDDQILLSTGDGRLVSLARAGCGAALCEPAWTGPVPGAAPGNVIAAGDVIYVATEAGTIAAFDLAGCGAPVCDPLVTMSTGSAVTGGPIVYQGRLVVGTADSRLVAFGLPG